jgi:hypothetical protein
MKNLSEVQKHKNWFIDVHFLPFYFIKRVFASNEVIFFNLKNHEKVPTNDERN